MLISITTIMKEVCLSLQYHMIDIYGWTGTISVIIAYALTSFEVEQDILIDILNIYGAFSIGYITFLAKVWQAFACEVIWLMIGLYSLVKNCIEP